MQQLEIKFFFPLTEQIPLDLDYKPCIEFEEEKCKKQTYIGYTLNNWNVTTSNNIGNTSFTIDVDNIPITIVSKNKPNFAKRWIYKTLGMKWKAK